MASLTGKFIKDTYQSLLKLIDNGNVTSTAKEITDGEGNGTGVSLSNDGSLDATGTVSFGSLKDSGENITVTKFVDEADGIGNNNNDTTIPTSAAVKNYVDTNVTAQDLDFQGDSGTGSVDLDSELLDIAGGTGIDTSASNQTLTVSIDSTVATLTGTQTLTNKTVDADNNTVSNLEVDNLKSGVLDTDLTTVSASDDTLASAKAIKTYVDSNITAQDLDITDGTTTSAVDLDSQTLTIEGTANEVEVSLTDQTFTLGLPTSITTNVTGDLTGNADTASALETARTISLSGDVAGSVSFDGSANADITATIQANSVALGTDTTGDYVENLGTGTGVTIGSNTGEGSSPTISVDYGSTENTAVQGNTSLTIQGTANEIEVTGGGVTLGSGGTVTVGLPDDVSLGGSLTIAQNLTVNGTTTTVNTDTLSVEDPLIELARDNSENSVDVGLYGKYSLDSGVTTKYSGLFKDASDSDKFKLFKGLEVEPTATVDTAGTGYTKGDLVINDLDAVTISGTISTAAQPNITSVGTLSSLAVSGNLAVDTNTLYVDASSNGVGFSTTNLTVGIGNTDTGASIRSVGAIQASRDGNRSLYLNRNTTDGQIISINRDGSEVGAIGAVGSGLTFYTGITERMRIDSSGNVGIGTTDPSFPLHVQKNSGAYEIITIQNNSSAALYRAIGNGGGSVDFGAEVNTADTAIIRTGGTERMRIDSSGNVGIGTTNPFYKLHISATSAETVRYDNGTNFLHNFIDATGVYFNTDSNSYRFLLNSGVTEAMRIDSSGNVGIGVVPSNYAGYTTLCLNDTIGSQIEFFTSGVQKAYIEGTSEILKFQHNDAYPIVFNTNATERMRITSAGVLQVGSTAGYTTISQGAFFTKGGGDMFTANLLAGAAVSPMFKLQRNDVEKYNIGLDSNDNLAFINASGDAKMSITSGGNVLINTDINYSNLLAIDQAANYDGTSDSAGIRIFSTGGTGNSGDYHGAIQFSKGTGSAAISAVQDASDSDVLGLAFFTHPSTSGTAASEERMRITSAGKVNINNYAGGAYLNIDGLTTVVCVETLQNGSGTLTHYTFKNSNGAVGSISTSGSSTSYNTSSDYRLKENVVEMTGALDRVDALKPSRFNFIADADKTVDGFLAHQVQDIVPEAVTGEKDATEEYEVSPEVLDDEGNVVEEAVMGTRDVYQGIDQSKLVPLLVGAIKELRAEVNSLKAQINN